MVSGTCQMILEGFQCHGKVSDGLCKVSDGLWKVYDGIRKAPYGPRKELDCVPSKRRGVHSTSRSYLLKLILCQGGGCLWSRID